MGSKGVISMRNDILFLLFVGLLIGLSVRYAKYIDGVVDDGIREVAIETMRPITMK
jgi:hypothetical protein